MEEKATKLSLLMGLTSSLRIGRGSRYESSPYSMVSFKRPILTYLAIMGPLSKLHCRERWKPRQQLYKHEHWAILQINSEINSEIVSGFQCKILGIEGTKEWVRPDEPSLQWKTITDLKNTFFQYVTTISESLAWNKCEPTWILRNRGHERENAGAVEINNTDIKNRPSSTAMKNTVTRSKKQEIRFGEFS